MAPSDWLKVATTRLRLVHLFLSFFLSFFSFFSFFSFCLLYFVFLVVVMSSLRSVWICLTDLLARISSCDGIIETSPKRVTREKAKRKQTNKKQKESTQSIDIYTISLGLRQLSDLEHIRLIRLLIRCRWLRRPTWSAAPTPQRMISPSHVGAHIGCR